MGRWKRLRAKSIYRLFFRDRLASLSRIDKLFRMLLLETLDRFVDFVDIVIVLRPKLAPPFPYLINEWIRYFPWIASHLIPTNAFTQATVIDLSAYTS